LPSPRENRVLGALGLGIAAVLGIALLAIVFGPHSIGDYFTETDFYGSYAGGARGIQRGVIDASRYGVIGPVYEVALALTGFVIRDLFMAAQLISVASAIATLLFWIAIVRTRLSARVAVLAALFMATNTDFFRYGFSATTDAFAMALQAFAIWLLLTRTGHAATLGAGAAAALAFLTRYNAIFLVPLGAAVLLLGAGRDAGTDGSRGARLRAALLFAAGFAIPMLPWVLYSLSSGSGFSFQLHHNIAFEVFARPQGIVWDDYQKTLQPEFKTLWDVIARDPGAVASRMLFNLGDHLRLDARDLLGWPVAIAAGLGFTLTVFSGAWRGFWPLALAWALLFATLIPVFHAARYSLGLLPVYATLAGALFGLPAFALAAGRAPRVWGKPLLAAVPLFFAVQANVEAQRYNLRILPREVLVAAETLRELAAPGDRIIARKGHIGYYAGLEVVGFPFVDDLAGLAAYAKQNDARWLYMSWPEAWMRPQFWFLLDTTATVPGLTARRMTLDHPAVVYEIGPEFGTTPGWYANDTLRHWHIARAQLMVDGHNPDALFALGRIAHERGRLDEARPWLARLLENDPTHFGGLLIMGDVSMQQGDLETAARAFDRAMRIRPESVGARVGLGWVYLQSGRNEEAAELWRPVVASTPDPGTLQRMEMLFRALGDTETAERAAATLRALQGG
jgi:tetratricopeptide (TPR) repeat protein